MYEEQEKFEVEGDNGDHIRIAIVEVHGFPHTTSFLGGYDIRAGIKIKSAVFELNSTFYASTGEFYELLQQFLRCDEQLSGVVRYAAFEGDFEFSAEYSSFGHVQVKGYFLVNDETTNKLIFSFRSDQSYIKSSIRQLQALVGKYGDNGGAKSKY